jgi:phage-related tail fiber protein
MAQINLTHMAVGDGNGNFVEVSESQTNLVRELFRAAPNRVYQDPELPNKFTAELVIPATEGGFVLREVGVFDSSGGLFAVGNLPDTYKPMASEGAYADTVVRMEFMVTNASVVTLQIDPNVAVATQAWVINNVTPCSLFPGGTTGQILRKKTNGCGDTEWADPTDANVFVDSIEEMQTLADGQTVVTLAVCTTYGLSVYIEGSRLRGDEWTADLVDETKFTLAVSRPAGTRLVAVQNEPAGSAPYPLIRTLNLSDVPNKALARANLDVFSKAETRQMAPAGLVAYFARSSAPAGWLKANGAAISRTAYADLFAAIGTSFGEGDGFNTFNLPDARGEFLRCWDDGRDVDGGREFASYQSDRMQDHYHGTGDFGQEGNDDWWAIVRSWAGSFTGRWVAGESNSNKTKAITGADSGTRYTGTTNQHAVIGSETRPRNIALLACIKY